MLKDRSKDKFYGRSHLVRLRGKYTVQTAHCALGWILFLIYFSAPFPFRISCQAVSRVQQTILQSGLLPPRRKVPSPFPACNIIPAITFSPSPYLTKLFQSR